eukprot:12763249-Alexandrium_andersonii.AAC.1
MSSPWPWVQRAIRDAYDAFAASTAASTRLSLGGEWTWIGPSLCARTVACQSAMTLSCVLFTLEP